MNKPNYRTAADVFDDWRDDVLTGKPPTLYPVGTGELSRIEVGPKLVTLFGGAPGAGKTAFTMQCVVDALRLSHPDIAVTRQDVTRFEVDAEYDVVVLLGGLHHVPHEASRVVGRLARALKPGGYFISLEPTDGNPVFTSLRRWIYRRNRLFDEETERSFGLSEYYGMFKQAGLYHIDSFQPGLLAYVLYYNPDAFPWLNIGGPGLVRAIWALERPFRRSAIGRALSFATLGLWQRPMLPTSGPEVGDR